MRLHRLVIAVSSLALFPITAAHAQDARLFDNSWFWGVHAGAAMIGTPASSVRAEPTIGAEWMITRRRGGVYAAFDQTMLDRTSAVVDTSVAGGARNVGIHTMRTASIAAIAWPYHYEGFRPYAGVGAQLSVLGSAKPQLNPDGTVPSDVASRTENARSTAALFFLGGAQWQLGRAAVFGQLSATPSNGNFLITKPITTITGGVRYNFGSAIEQ